MDGGSVPRSSEGGAAQVENLSKLPSGEACGIPVKRSRPAPPSHRRSGLRAAALRSRCRGINRLGAARLAALVVAAHAGAVAAQRRVAPAPRAVAAPVDED